MRKRIGSAQVRSYWWWGLLSVAAAVGAWLFFGVFAFHTIFIDEEVDEPVPFFTAGPAPSGMEGDETTQEQADIMNEAMAESGMPVVMEVDDPMPSDMSDGQMAAAGMDRQKPDAGTAAAASGETAAPAAASSQDDVSSTGVESVPSQPGSDPVSDSSTRSEAPAGGVDSAADPAPSATTDPALAATTLKTHPEPLITVEASGQFSSRSHPTEGSVQVLGDGSGQRFLRLEDFRTDNGPDLNVYLSAASADAPAGEFDDDFVDLGDLKGNVGSQNYEIPLGLDLERYSTVTIWCVRFSVVFGVAELSMT